MTIVMLDSHPLSLVSHPSSKAEALNCKNRVKQLINHKVFVVNPEIIDYELRRVLIYANKVEGIENLDKLGDMGIIYASITTAVMRKASELWGWARKTGQQTANTDKIDVDVILAAQSIILSQETGEYSIIATSNVSDLQRYTDARRWEDITVEYCFNPQPSKSQ